MLIKTILNSIEKYKEFVYEKVGCEGIGFTKKIVVDVRPRKGCMGRCSACGKKCRTYDHTQTRLCKYVPLWNIPVYFRYRARRVSCSEHGVVVEKVPWVNGKERCTNSFKFFLATWAKRLPWQEVARIFKVDWKVVYRSVKEVVEYGLKKRNLDGITSVGFDEIVAFKGREYLTVGYQIDEGKKRLLWCNLGRKASILAKFFDLLGKERTEQIKFICSDMWGGYLKAIKEKAPGALNILDRFHIIKRFNEVIDDIRSFESKQIGKSRDNNPLENSRWVLLKNKENLTEKQVCKLSDLLKQNLLSVKAYLLKEDFKRFWKYDSRELAERFLDEWINRTLRSNIVHMSTLTRMLKLHKPLILNWFTAGKTFSSGVVEGLNNKAKLTMRKAYGFRTVKCLQIALYHNLGNLPEPDLTHRFG